jgi:hypothetical protein
MRKEDEEGRKEGERRISIFLTVFPKSIFLTVLLNVLH